MRGGAERKRRRRCAAVLSLILLAAPVACAAAGADLLCDRAERAERDARDAERKSAERRQFLERGKTFGLSGQAASRPVSPAAVQSVRAQMAQVRSLLPEIRRGVAAAQQDRGIVPGLSQYFGQMEVVLENALQSVESCLADPERCTPPSIYCPAPPNIPVYSKKNVASADLIRQVQANYVRSADMVFQACRNLQSEASREIDRMRQESRNAAAARAAQQGADGQRIGEIDLYLRRAESLRREAAQYRLEADRVSGKKGYCASRGRAGFDAARARAAAEALRRRDSQRKDDGIPPNGKVIDLKAAWARQWNGGPKLEASDVPLPKAQADSGSESFFGRVDDYLYEKMPGYAAAKDYLSENVPWWWYKAKSLYREADSQVELTEFIKSRPKELLKDAVTELVENSFGSVGKTVTTAYKITSAVKSTSDEVGEILGDAPRVIVHGSEADALELSERAGRVPVKFGNELFDDVSGKFPPPRYTYQYKKAFGDGDGN